MLQIMARLYNPMAHIGTLHSANATKRLLDFHFRILAKSFQNRSPSTGRYISKCAKSEGLGAGGQASRPAVTRAEPLCKSNHQLLVASSTFTFSFQNRPWLTQMEIFGMRSGRGLTIRRACGMHLYTLYSLCASVAISSTLVTFARLRRLPY